MLEKSLSQSNKYAEVGTITLDDQEENVVENVENGGNKDTVTVPQIRHHGITLDWSDISLTVSQGNDGTKTLLHSMAGSARPGEMLAIMGSSGAGKSTLLDVLSGRLDSEELKGVITANGAAIDRKEFRKVSGYVMQSDALFPLLTVRETFQFAAYLRIPNKTRAQKKAVAEEFINLLRLQKAADTIVGDDDNRGVSGGEKRRVSIGVDIIHSPVIIFLDEPTSGLDSTTAYAIMDSLKQIAVDQNSTIVMTIHQPSSRLFNLMDKVIFLAEGKVSYHGPVSELQPLIKQLYAELDMGEMQVANPPELFLELCDSLITQQKLDIVTSRYSGTSDKAPEYSNRSLQAGKDFANNWFVEVALIFERAFKNLLRFPELFFARLGATIFFGVQIGTLYLFTSDSRIGLDNRAAYIVFTLAFYYWTSLEALPIFIQEREIFQREYSRGAYRASSFALATFLVYIPFYIIIAAVYSVITFFLVGLPASAGQFFYHAFCIFTVVVTGSTFATMISTLVPNPMIGQTSASSIFAVMFLFSGFFIVRRDIPLYWIYFHYLSLFKYAYDDLMTNALQTVDIVVYTNDQLLRIYGVEQATLGHGMAILWGFIIFFRLVFYYRLLTAFNGSRK